MMWEVRSSVVVAVTIPHPEKGGGGQKDALGEIGVGALEGEDLGEIGVWCRLFIIPGTFGVYCAGNLSKKKGFALFDLSLEFRQLFFRERTMYQRQEDCALAISS